MTVFEVRMELACTRSHARVARAAAAACGALEGFSNDDLGDLRLLVDEVFTTMHALGVRRVDLRLVPSDGALVVLVRSRESIGHGRSDVDVRFTESLAGVVGCEVHFDLLGSPPNFAATVRRS